jgi:hypothetical protein
VFSWIAGETNARIAEVGAAFVAAMATGIAVVVARLVDCVDHTVVVAWKNPPFSLLRVACGT